jgi:hypothetical protein
LEHERTFGTRRTRKSTKNAKGGIGGIRSEKKRRGTKACPHQRTQFVRAFPRLTGEGATTACGPPLKFPQEGRTVHELCRLRASGREYTNNKAMEQRGETEDGY